MISKIRWGKETWLQQSFQGTLILFRTFSYPSENSTASAEYIRFSTLFLLLKIVDFVPDEN